MFNLALAAAAVVVGALLSLWLPWYGAVAPVLGGLALFGLVHLWSIRSVRSQPRLAVILSPASYGVVFVVIAATTYASVLAGTSITAWIAASGSELSDTVAGVVTGAIAGLIGAAWLDNAKDPSGALWPAGAYKAALRKAFWGAQKLDHPRSPDMELLYQAAFDDRAQNGEIEGWGFAARWRRAVVIRTYD